VVVWLVLFPIITFLHECGHALAVLALTGQDVTILLGSGRRGMKWQWGKLGVVVGWLTGFVGFTKYDQERLTSRQILWVTLAGPLVSLLLTVACSAPAFTRGIPQGFVILMRIVAYATLAQFLFTILPLRYPRWLLAYGGKTSDGWRALQLLRVKFLASTHK